MNKKQLVKDVYKHNKTLAKEVASALGLSITAKDNKDKTLSKLNSIYKKLDKVLTRTHLDESARFKPNTVFNPIGMINAKSPFTNIDLKEFKKYNDEYKYIFQATVSNFFYDIEKFEKFDNKSLKAFEKIVLSQPGINKIKDKKVISSIKDGGDKMSITILFNQI